MHYPHHHLWWTDGYVYHLLLQWGELHYNLLLMSKQYFEKLRAKRKALGLCLSCGKNPSPCESCRSRNREYMRRKRAGIPQEEKKRQWHSKRHYFLKYKFGITEEQYDKMLADQGGCCAICKSSNSGNKRSSRLSIDHCHSTGKIRGLLCSSCNKAIGLMKDSQDILVSAISYLNRS